MEQQQEPQQQQDSQETTEAFRSYEEARLQRERTEGRCLLGFVIWTIVQQALARRPS